MKNIERLIFTSAIKDMFFEAVNSIRSIDVYHASTTTQEKGIFFLNSICDKLFSSIKFAFEIFRIWRSNRQIGFKVYRKMLGIRYKAIGNHYIGIFLLA